MRRAAAVVHLAVELERLRQEAKREDGVFSWTCADPTIANVEKLPVLLEEVGEVARALLERSNLREELVHVAAVAAAWIEALDLEAPAEVAA